MKRVLVCPDTEGWGTLEHWCWSVCRSVPYRWLSQIRSRHWQQRGNHTQATQRVYPR